VENWAWWDWLLTWLTNHCPSLLWHCWLSHTTHKILSEMTCNVLIGTLNPTIPYRGKTGSVFLAGCRVMPVYCVRSRRCFCCHWRSQCWVDCVVCCQMLALTLVMPSSTVLRQVRRKDAMKSAQYRVPTLSSTNNVTLELHHSIPAWWKPVSRIIPFLVSRLIVYLPDTSDWPNQDVFYAVIHLMPFCVNIAWAFNLAWASFKHLLWL